jgi:hypothetical protein
VEGIWNRARKLCFHPYSHKSGSKMEEYNLKLSVTKKIMKREEKIEEK